MSGTDNRQPPAPPIGDAAQPMAVTAPAAPVRCPL